MNDENLDTLAKFEYATPISDGAMLESLIQMALRATLATQAIILLIEETPRGRFGAIAHNMASEQEIADYLWHLLEELARGGIHPTCLDAVVSPTKNLRADDK